MAKITSVDIARSNDLLRMTLLPNAKNKVMLSAGVADSDNQIEILMAVRGFKDWSKK